MPTRSKFTAEIRNAFLDSVRIGASRYTAAHHAGINPSQITRWMKHGEEAPSSRFGEFREAVLKAEAEPKLRALAVVHRELPDKPELAWKFLERREPGYAPPMPNMRTMPSAPVVINLTLDGGQPVKALPSSVVEVLEQDSEAGTA